MINPARTELHLSLHVMERQACRVRSDALDPLLGTINLSTSELHFTVKTKTFPALSSSPQQQQLYTFFRKCKLSTLYLCFPQNDLLRLTTLFTVSSF